MKTFITDLINMRTGRVINLAIYDCFDGEVKIIKNRFYKWLIEIVDVSMCYPCLKQAEPGERMWIHRKDIYRENRRESKKAADERLPF